MRMPAKSGAAKRSENSPFEREFSRSANGYGILTTKSVYEFVPICQIVRLQGDFERAVQFGQGSVEINLRSGRCNFTFGDRENLRVFRVVKNNPRGYWNYARNAGDRRRPVRYARDAKMLKVGNPGVDRIDVDCTVPVQRIDGEALVVDCGERVGKATVMEVSLRSEGQRFQIHFETAIEAAFERADGQIFNREFLARNREIAPCFQSRGVKPFVRHFHVVAVEVACAAPIAGIVARISGEIGGYIWRKPLAKNRADVFQREPAAIVDCPIRLRKTGKFGAQIQFGMG